MFGDGRAARGLGKGPVAALAHREPGQITWLHGRPVDLALSWPAKNREEMTL